MLVKRIPAVKDTQNATGVVRRFVLIRIHRELKAAAVIASLMVIAGCVNLPTVPIADVAEALLASFDSSDGNNDAFLSYAEAAIGYPGLSQAQFDEIDTNADARLDRAELLFTQGDSRGTSTYTITIQNLSNQPLGPVVAATHPDTTVMWRLGEDASAGVQTVAEMGNPAPLFAEVTAQFDANAVTDLWNTGRPLTRMGVTQAAFGPFAPGADLIDHAEFEITASAGDLFSCASMAIITNDGFWGVDSVGLPESGEKTLYAFAYDAGTEENTELSSDLDDGGSVLAAAPLPNDDTNPDVNDNGGTPTSPRGTIQLHPGIQGVGDLDAATFGWNEPIAVITIRKNSSRVIDEPLAGDMRTYQVSIQNFSNQPLGPVVSATHPRGTVMWRIDNDASSGIQTVAEMGNPAPLVAELTPLVDSGDITELYNTGRPLARAGVTQPAFGPFAPGADLIDNATFEIVGKPGDLFSCASMVIITNDGFWGLDGAGLPASGSQTFYAFAYDAGTEQNSELSSDLDDGGSVLAAATLPNDDTDPAVNDNGGTPTDPRGTIDLHLGIVGGGDLDPAVFDWTDPIASVTISVVE